MSVILSSFYAVFLLSSAINAQQNYSSHSCGSKEPNGHPAAASLYSCNGKAKSCNAFLLFKSKPPYDSVPSISNLTSSDQENLARINNVTSFSAFPTDMEVIVPLVCSCMGRFYQANTTFIVNLHETYYVVATDIYQGSVTCESLRFVNGFDEFDLQPGMILQVPLRCACPTRSQTENGIKYLLTYLVGNQENVAEIVKKFNVSEKSVHEANVFRDENPKLSPFSTILVPLPTEPSSSQIVSPPSSHNRFVKKSQRDVCIHIAKGVGFFLLVLTAIVFAVTLLYKMRPKGTSHTHKNIIRKWVPPADLRVEIASLDRAVKVFGFEEVTKATGRFSQKNRIHGSVYRGKFGKKMILAVKRTRADATMEVNMLKKVYHFNLVKLEGVCENHGRFYLLFEYMENGSLREWLDRGSNEDKRSWGKRIQMALDIANGLLYLHSFTDPAYVHNNISSSNILLNNNLRAKVSNFSLARTTERAMSNSVLTTNIVGTKGYMAPEYREAGLVTPKIDVYALGVVILELISGKKAIFVEKGREELLSAAVISTMGKNVEAGIERFVDSSIKEAGKIEFALLMARLSAACLIQEPERRPSMGEVVSTVLKIQAHLQKLIYSRVDPYHFEELSNTETNVEL